MKHSLDKKMLPWLAVGLSLTAVLSLMARRGSALFTGHTSAALCALCMALLLTVYAVARREIARRVRAERALAHYNAQLEAQHALLEHTTDSLTQSNALFAQASRRFEELFQGLPAACFSFDADGRIVEWNRACEQLYGLSGTDSIGRPFWDALPETPNEQQAQEAAARQMVARVFDGEAFPDTEHDARGPGGAARVFLSSTFPLRGPDGVIVGGIRSSTDITARKEAEATQARLIAILEATSDFVGTADGEGRIVQHNRAFLALTGDDAASVQRKRISDMHPPWVLAQMESQMPAALEQHGVWSGETALLNSLGEEVPVSQVVVAHKDAQGEITHTSTIARDISAVKRAQEKLEHSVAERTSDLAIVNDFLQEAHAALHQANAELEARVAERTAALREANEKLRALVDAAPLAIFDFDPDGRVRTWNDAAEAIFGWTEQEAIGEFLPIVPPGKEHEFFALRDRLLAGEAFTHVEARRRRKDGSPIDVSISAAPLRDGEGRVQGAIAVVVDITERNRAEQQLREANAKLELLATEDSMTGLKNHRAFQERLELEFGRAVRYNTPLSLLMLDVDKFKQYNDIYGHPAGNAVLRAVARLLKEHARETDLVARYGGEEFVVVLPHTDHAGALALAERMRAAIADAPWSECAVTASFGIATRTATTREAAQMMAEADVALYASKDKGRNAVSHFADASPERKQEAGQEHRTERVRLLL